LHSIGFGTWAWGNQILWGYNSHKDDLILEETFIKAVKGGLSLIDTADSYGNFSLNGRSETLLGSFIEKLPANLSSRVKVATKLAPYPWRFGNRGFQKAFLASRKRLRGNLNRVQLHWSTARYAPWQEMPLINNLAFLCEQGYVKELGLSNIGPQRLQIIYDHLSAKGIKLKSLQVQFSLLSSNSVSNNKKSLSELCKKLDIELIAYSPLAFGILTIPPKEIPKKSTLLRDSIFKRLLPSSKNLRKVMHNIAKDNNASMAQVALNWCRAHSTIPIPGLRKPYQAEEAINALKWKLTIKEKTQLDEANINCIERMPNNPFQSK
tara:strand:+ start:792 stop:1757 length:966 start_codon:yes stop_codon:yes gene_type:complete